LQCDERFRIGDKAKWYRLAPPWQDKGIHRATIRTERILRRITSFTSGRERRSSWQSQHRHLNYCLKLVTLDRRKVVPWICQQARSRKQHLTALRVEILQRGEGRIIVDRYGRVHSPVTNLRKTVRAALLLNGQEVIEVDVGSAQPLLAGYIAAKLIASDWSLAQVQRLGEAKDMEHPFTGMQLTAWSARLPADLIEYIEICQHGEFYAELARLWNLPFETPKDKNRLKRAAFRWILFGPIRHDNGHWKAFRRRWPSVATALETIKRDDHGTSARVCQRIESKLVIEGVVGQMLLHDPTVPILTIHDSLLVRRGDVEQAREAISTAFTQVGLKPTVKVK
jgi:hypothetical protein